MADMLAAIKGGVMDNKTVFTKRMVDIVAGQKLISQLIPSG